MDILKNLARFLNKKAQGLPIYAVIVIVLGIVVLAVVLIYILMVSGKGADISKIFFNLSGNVAGNATNTACQYKGTGCV